MRQSYSKELDLQAFSAELVDFAALLSGIADFAPEENAAGVTIRVNLEEKELSFDSVDELLADREELPDRLTSFSVHFRCRCSASSTDEIWIAGVLNSVKDFVRRNRRWIWVVRLLPVAIAITISPFLLLSALIALAFSPVSLPLIGWVALVSPLTVLGLAALRFPHIFPLGALVVRRTDGVLRRYATEITVVAAIVSVVVSIIAILVSL